MNIWVGGVDHSIADVQRREQYAIPAAQQADLLERIAADDSLLGAVILSTCNRTEIYLSAVDGAQPDPFALFPVRPAQGYCYSEHAAFSHLALLASGFKSRIFAEDQILTQVKFALKFAREANAVDGSLEVFFREAVSAAKRIKTDFRFSHGDVSAAAAARDLLVQAGGVHRVLVIGNGEIGRAAAQELAQAGMDVTMTLRSYRHSEIPLPSGVSAIDYNDRFSRMQDMDAVVSATTSPHYTVTKEALLTLSRLPGVFLDLAMPRDIDPAVTELGNVRLLDIDQVADAAGRRQKQTESLQLVEPIIEEAWEHILKWSHGKALATQPRRHTHFPLFVPTSGLTALVVGGGRIATRRVLSLTKFDFDLCVVAPQVSDAIAGLAQSGRIELAQRAFSDDDLEDVYLVVAATDSREVNHHIAVLARHRQIYASIVDQREECSFYFPAVAEDGDVVVGVCGNGVSHHEVAVTAKRIREALEE